ncbi:MAG: hypothetical protein HC915_16840, partial [Anaerolineae bacterium]|nr:hypothetical protein [Anaerolineae bacterium]
AAIEPPPPPPTPLYRYPMPDRTRRRLTRPWLIAGVIGAMVLLSVVVVGGVLLLANANSSSADRSGEGSPTPVVTLNTQSLDVPRLRVDLPANNSTVQVGETIVIEVSAFDRLGVTRIERTALWAG